LDTDLVDRLSKLTNYQSHAYSFTYDGANRMLNATHGNNRYTEKVTEYDKNGNIKKLQRYGQTGASSYGLVDNLTYTYNGNQLTKVEDAVTATSYTGGTNFVNGSTAATEYTYDNNGNLTKDLNKGISSIQYNSLSLPSQVLFDNGATQTYHYTADGEKWRTVYTAGLLLKDTVDYCDGAIVENGVLKKLLTPVGYVDMSGTTPSYYYYLKDHQGNNRVVINANEGDAVEVNHYYPFGSLFSTSTNVQPYKYNGKELDTKKGLNWYDYGARHYDAVLGRWHVVDPLAEDMATWSPYTYCFNNPMKFVDEEGESPLKVLKVAFNIGKRTYKTYKRSGKLNLKQALKEEGVNIVDNVQTLFDDEASTTDKIFAGIDLLTGFGGEVKDASKSLGIIDDAVDVGKKRIKSFSDIGLKNGMTMTSSDILDTAEDFLGKGYKEVGEGTGRYVSKDGTRVFRMGNNDIEGKHAGGSHVNLEILETNPDKPEKMRIIENIHVYIKD